MFVVALAVAAPSEADKQQIRSTIAAADRAYRESAFEDAARLYLDAHRSLEKAGLPAKPELLYNAGLAYERLGACERVVELFHRFLKAKPSASNDELLERLEKAERCAPEVVIQTSPAGAAISVDGVARGTAPVRMPLRSGGHTLSATLDAHKPLERAFAVETGKPLALDLVLVPLVGTGRLELQVADAAEIFLDGEALGRGPFRGVREVKAGRHQLKLVREGCEPAELSIEVPAGSVPYPVSGEVACVPVAKRPADPVATVPKIISAPPSRERSPALLWTGVAVGGAGVVAGSIFTAMYFDAVSARDGLLEQPEDTRPGRPIREADNDAFRSSVGLSIAFSAAAVGLSLAAYALFIEE